MTNTYKGGNLDPIELVGHAEYKQNTRVLVVRSDHRIDIFKASRLTDHVQSGKSVDHDKNICKSRCGGYGDDIDARNSELDDSGRIMRLGAKDGSTPLTAKPRSQLSCGMGSTGYFQ